MYAERRLEIPPAFGGLPPAPADGEVARLARIVLAAVRRAGTRGASVAELAADVGGEVDVGPAEVQGIWNALKRDGRVVARLDPVERVYRIYASSFGA